MIILLLFSSKCLVAGTPLYKKQSKSEIDPRTPLIHFKYNFNDGSRSKFFVHLSCVIKVILLHLLLYIAFISCLLIYHVLYTNCNTVALLSNIQSFFIEILQWKYISLLFYTTQPPSFFWSCVLINRLVPEIPTNTNKKSPTPTRKRPLSTAIKIKTTPKAKKTSVDPNPPSVKY